MVREALDSPASTKRRRFSNAKSSQSPRQFCGNSHCSSMPNRSMSGTNSTSALTASLTVNNKLCRLGFDESTASPESAQSFGWLSQNKTYWLGGGSARLIGTSRALQRGCARAPLARQAKTKPVKEAFVSFSTQTNLPPLKTTSSLFRPNPPK